MIFLLVDFHPGILDTIFINNRDVSYGTHGVMFPLSRANESYYPFNRLQKVVKSSKTNKSEMFPLSRDSW